MKLRFFCSRIVIEIPHFASLRGKEREIKILRSNNGEKWEEHPIVATDEAVQKALNESLEGRKDKFSLTYKLYLSLPIFRNSIERDVGM